ncbi:MAG: cation/cationic drug transporter [Bacillota bacterium]
MQAWLMALLSILLSSAGQLLIKQGLNLVQRPGLPAFAYLVAALTNLQVVSGLAAYGLGAIIWLLALRQSALSQMYPLVSLSYVLVAAGSVLLLGESLPPGRIAGLAVIILGVILVARS